MISLPPQASPEELLSLVRPLYPNEIFPLGSGWRIVFYTLIGLVLAGFLFYNSPRMKRRREAFYVYDELRRCYFDDADISALSAGLSVLMRRVALHRFGREQTADLQGTSWTAFLNQTGAELDETDTQLLENQAYAPSLRENDLKRGRHLLTSVRRWLEKNL